MTKQHDAHVVSWARAEWLAASLRFHSAMFAYASASWREDYVGMVNACDRGSTALVRMAEVAAKLPAARPVDT